MKILGVNFEAKVTMGQVVASLVFILGLASSVGATMVKIESKADKAELDILSGELKAIKAELVLMNRNLEAVIKHEMEERHSGK